MIAHYIDHKQSAIVGRSKLNVLDRGGVGVQFIFEAYYNKAQRGKFHPEVNEGLIPNTRLDIDGQI